MFIARDVLPIELTKQNTSLYVTYLARIFHLLRNQFHSYYEDNSIIVSDKRMTRYL